ncbi:MAG: UDP-3-O-[3-hydroxymyristoyl] N-acetylglucosamine deacetylase, partial [Planctomycetota bacterium]|nr:UDP-3-O-[3-hydroxymyristoyl] N-acetylglucosamine deacetylase [Planctomycetota bacterium]
KTIARETDLEGVGLHSGATVKLTLSPAAPGEGIVFERRDLDGAPTVALGDVQKDALPLRTALKRGAAEVHTVEHLLAALAGVGVTDVRLGLTGPEIPGMDGSAMPFVIAMHEAGIVELPGEPLEPIVVTEPVTLNEGAATMTAQPFDAGFKVTYTLDYPGEPLAQGTRELVITEQTFLREIASARTFCMKKEAEQLRAAGFGKGANTRNTLVLDGAKVMDNAFRFPDEPVRHKILDLVGDLYLLGRPVRGHIVAQRSGHKMNRAMADRLAARKDA